MVSKQVRIVSLGLLILLLMMARYYTDISAQTIRWTEPVNLSNTPHGSWFPDLTVDDVGNVHVIWCETTTLPIGHKEQVYYTMWDGQAWSEPNDIVPPSPDIIRNSSAADHTGRVHMLFGGSVPNIGNLSIFHVVAPVLEARSAAAWSTPHRLSDTSYMGDIAVDVENSIHVVYDELITSDVEMDGETYAFLSADIFYRRSADGGKTWTSPVNLYPSPLTGSAREQIEIDSRETIHVTWDEGWDRLTGIGEPIYSVYTSSSDGGVSWRPSITVTYPSSGTAQLTPGADGRGGTMLVWRSPADEYDGIYYQWSSDDAGSWSPPERIPGVFARRWQGPFDMYDMATDSAGHIHLVVVAWPVKEFDALLGVYHLEWDGASWSRPEVIYRGGGFPEYPKIAISQGNQLHVVWFVADAAFEESRREVWYSSSQSTAPSLSPPPSLTPSPLLTVTPTPRAVLLPTPLPTLGAGVGGLPDGLYTEADELLRLGMALSPVVILVVLVLVVQRGWFKR